MLKEISRCGLVFVSLVLAFAAMPAPVLADDEVVVSQDNLIDKPELASDSDEDVAESEIAALADDAIVETGEDVPPSPVDNKSRLLISEFQLSGRAEKPGYFVELYNNSDVAFVESGWRLEYVVANTSDSGFGEVRLLADLDFSDLDFDPRGYIVVGGAATDDIEINTVTTNASQGYIRIVDNLGETVDLLGYGSATAAKNAEGGKPITASKVTGKSVQRCESTGKVIVDTDVNLDDFANYETSTPSTGVSCAGGDGYEQEVVNQCSGLVLNEIGANLSEQFIEVRNITGSVLDISGCGLKTNRSSKVFTFENMEVDADDHLALSVSDTGLTLTKTTTGTVYLLNSAGGIIESESYANLASGTSWAHFAGGWAQTYTTTPNDENIYTEFAACQVGYERNLDTGRCRKIVVAAVLADCGEGKYRNPETNRCRSLASLATAYSPCAEGYYRNPETNRCKKIASEDGPKPCQAGYERNPETNRCRKVRVNNGADYGVEANEANDMSSFVGWVAFGGLALAGLSYVGFEFRHEIVKFVRKIKLPHIGGKK